MEVDAVDDIVVGVVVLVVVVGVVVVVLVVDELVVVVVEVELVVDDVVELVVELESFESSPETTARAIPRPITAATRTAISAFMPPLIPELGGSPGGWS